VSITASDGLGKIRPARVRQALAESGMPYMLYFPGFEPTRAKAEIEALVLKRIWFIGGDGGVLAG